MDIGQNKTFSATSFGGSGSYKSYQWLVSGAAQSGQTASTFNFSLSSSGSYSVTVTVTDSLGATSVPSTAATVTVNIAPTVSVSSGATTLDVGQVQTFSATPSGGSGTVHYQWYLGGTTSVGNDSSTYSFSGPVGSYSVTCKVTDSASTPVTSPASNVVSVTVNSALVPPSVSASLGTVDQGQTSSLTSTAVSTGTSP
ncbi:MAG: PKD domain-containing protein, partial [Candidatus Bathyarchaeia archaeon]